MASKEKYTQITKGSIDHGSPAYVLALDIGTTNLRAHIYDRSAKIIAGGSQPMELLYPKPGLVELDENVLWDKVQAVIKEAISAGGLTASDITCMGITVQRNTFITWDKDTGKPFHHFIGWQDLRASKYVKQWNNSFTLSGLNKAAKLLWLVTRKMRFLAAAVLSFNSAQVVLRLKWQIEHDEQLQKRVQEEKVMYGSIETWLLWKFTGGKVWASDYSNASSTCLFDPFQMKWSPIVSGLLRIPLHLFPPLYDTSCHFGDTDTDIFGASIPITCLVADQQSAMFGQCCFKLGDVKCTMGSGTFIGYNSGSTPHASIAGLYPLIGWKIKDECVYVAEGLSSDTGHCLEWAKRLGIFDDVEDLDEMCRSVPDANGAQFIPAFSGLQAPINDDKACATFFGLKLDTSKAHMVRALMQALAFRYHLLYQTVRKEAKSKVSDLIKCDGGVCRNDFLMQLVSDITGKQINRPEHMDMTSLGAAFLAGLAVGVWQNKEELIEIRRTQRVFEPNKQRAAKIQPIFDEWMKALERSKGWYKDVST